ncbi:MAG: GerMN domain-containing protein [Treponemataceae bacterium]|nr:GerMN domain-containing protein [Treponemataceae bacterium]
MKKTENNSTEKNTSAPKKKSSAKKKPKAGLIFWLAFALIIVLAFVIAKGRIANVLKETDFFNEVTGSEPALITDLVNSNETISSEKKKKSKKKSDEKTEKSIFDINENQRSEADLTERSEVENKAKKKKAEKTEELPTAKKEESIEKVVESVSEKTASEKTEEKKEDAAPVKMMNLNLCFVQIDADGSILRRESLRKVSKNDSPLTTALNLLLAGPDKEEKDKGYISVIPASSKLLGAKISNKTAILNFNEDFTYNSYGVQGQIAQLMQIVYTATSFATIDNVQFLINGEKIEYLGGEGVWIGSPLSRFSFK